MCLQENRWKGNSAKELSGGCKLWYGGASLGENRVRIVLTKEIKEYLVEVSRKRVRGIWVKISINEDENVVCAYDPQTGCKQDDKYSYNFLNKLATKSNHQWLWKISMKDIMTSPRLAEKGFLIEFFLIMHLQKRCNIFHQILFALSQLVLLLLKHF